MGRTGEPAGSIQFTCFVLFFFLLRGGRPSYLPVELWEGQQRRKERTIHTRRGIYKCCGWPRDPFSSGSLFFFSSRMAAAVYWLPAFFALPSPTTNTTVIITRTTPPFRNRFSWLAATIILIPCCFIHFHGASFCVCVVVVVVEDGDFPSLPPFSNEFLLITALAV